MAVPPPPNDDEMWRALLNFLYLHGRDGMFRGAQSVREELEKEQRRGAA